MAKRKSHTKEIVKLPPVSREKAPYWDFFFSKQRSPFLRSQLVTALMSGHVLEVERLPKGALLDAVVLSTASRVYCEAEIVDDYSALVRRTNDVWREPMFSHKVMDSIHINIASFITMGANEFQNIEDQYIPELTGWLLNQDPPEYIRKELVK